MSGPGPDSRITVTAEEGGQRLDVLLAARLGESRSRAAARLTRGEVRVDGDLATKSHRVVAGQRVEVAAPPEPETGAAGVPAPPVRYEDEHVLVVAKPAGLVVHPAVGTPSGTLVQALAATGVPLAPAAGERRPGVVHRLDRDTSGLLVLAKTDEAYTGLVAALKARTVSRRYLVLAEGELPAESGRIEAPIGRDPRDRKRFAAVADGKPSITRWEVLQVGAVPAPAGDTSARGLPVERETVSLLTCRLETGRTHQIRVHLQFAGHPVVADPTYGGHADVAGAFGLSRMFLHAAWLAFTHPVTGAEVAVHEPLPDDLAAAAARAGLRTDWS